MKLYKTLQEETEQNILNILESDKTDMEKIKCIEKAQYNMSRRIYMVFMQKVPNKIHYAHSTDTEIPNTHRGITQNVITSVEDVDMEFRGMD
jgi:hypothetical protein